MVELWKQLADEFVVIYFCIVYNLLENEQDYLIFIHIYDCFLENFFSIYHDLL